MSEWKWVKKAKRLSLNRDGTCICLKWNMYFLQRLTYSRCPASITAKVLCGVASCNTMKLLNTVLPVAVLYDTSPAIDALDELTPFVHAATSKVYSTTACTHKRVNTEHLSFGNERWRVRSSSLHAERKSRSFVYSVFHLGCICVMIAVLCHPMSNQAYDGFCIKRKREVN